MRLTLMMVGASVALTVAYAMLILAASQGTL